MGWLIFKAVVAGVVVAVVSEIARTMPRAGGLILSLPLVSLVTFIFTWVQHRDLATVSNLARETPLLVLAGLPFFLPLAFADRMGLSFWPAFGLGIALGGACVALWIFWLAPRVL